MKMQEGYGRKVKILDYKDEEFDEDELFERTIGQKLYLCMCLEMVSAATCGTRRYLGCINDR